MDKKYRTRIGGGFIGLAGAAAVAVWPQHVVPIQMALYTMIIFGPLALGLWSDRRRNGFWTGVLLLLVLHGFGLYFARTMFPFRTILAVIPMALVEATAMLILMLRYLVMMQLKASDASPCRTENFQMITIASCDKAFNGFAVRFS